MFNFCISHLQKVKYLIRRTTYFIEIKAMRAKQNLSSSRFHCWNSTVCAAVTDTVTKNMKKTLAPPNFHSDECSLLTLLGSLSLFSL